MQTAESVKAQAANGARRHPLDRLRHWLTGWRGLTILGLVIMSGGLALGWGWLTAIGLAPIILSLGPCVVMCAIGACAMSRGGSNCAEPAVEKVEQPTPPAAPRDERLHQT
jgi:hypothetical protein